MPESPPPEKREILDTVAALMAPGAGGPEDFEAAALRLFAYQFEAVAALGAFWRSLAATPETVRRSADIPPVPLAAFKRRVIYGGGPPVRTFRTSGTSGRGRGSAPFDADDLALMDRSILANAGAHLFADGARARFFMLVPPPEEAPEVIMAYGMRVIADRFGLGEPFYAVRRGVLELEAGLETLAAWRREKDPVCLVGGSFGFVNFMDAAAGRRPGPLPEGSRLLDAGGFKGRSRELDRTAFVAEASGFFGLDPDRCYNLYGLTELASQFYSRNRGPKVPPPWARARVVDPLTLEEVLPGRTGVPLLLDLANVSRPMAVLTDDIAVNLGGGRFDVVGRASGAAPRGCSLSLEEVRPCGR
ncbi:hypothetical protein G3N55_00865 [Dissulfurirhabdus thermomarina]|uniref:Acyl-protein synthetase LuxE domain-containing protein n=1 Tax=Dissulfurirhabdus thermomarina TaxID=1765737 RepID=A0A6N9TMV6_DISTH|nr:hypothetical protein [Dissulfurirhabdus thermomarina]NDY41403.1 hypothetical protein [Dissulfurirhabdus thermomarina]NMX23581.1 hypothetical protein [Dissulfurirhabdus thermomarina]